ncbi:MAG TPA: helix-turn-helix transcriptional regulator [Chitinophagales bacterium]|nr:helix-turn-helix transcriptional regulator [Chitinophagales bacterium]
MNIGKAIKEIRKQRGFSQIELAAKVGLTQASISQIELELKRPTKRNLNALCKELEIAEPLLYLLAMEPSDVPKKHKMKYDALFPIVKNLISQIVE